jgi:hypothetical protein
MNGLWRLCHRKVGLAWPWGAWGAHGPPQSDAHPSFRIQAPAAVLFTTPLLFGKLCAQTEVPAQK